MAGNCCLNWLTGGASLRSCVFLISYNRDLSPAPQNETIISELYLSIKRSQSCCGVFTFLRKNDLLPSQQTPFWLKVRTPTVQTTLRTLIVLTMSIWWPLAWHGAAGHFPVQTASSEGRRSCENEKSVLCFLLKTAWWVDLVWRSVSRTAESFHWKKLNKNKTPSLSQQFNHTSIKTQHRALDSIRPSVRSSSGDWVSIVVSRCRLFSHLGWRMDIMMTDHHYSGSGGLFQHEGMSSSVRKSVLLSQNRWEVVEAAIRNHQTLPW